MAFCEKEKQLIDGGMTCIDNKFILNFLPDAPEKCVAVYLLGLALADTNGSDNSCEAIAAKLGLEPEDVMAAYLYWEELGLVHLTFDNPQKVVYLNVRETYGAAKKIKPGKYAKFTREIQNVISGRMITPNEFNEYYLFLESTTFEQEALVAVAKYCVELKGTDINYRYILTVARNQLQRGATTLAVVQDNLNSQQKYDEDLKIVFKELALTRKFEYTDREAFEKWTKDFGFGLDVIANVAKSCKGKGINKLDALLTEYYKKGALSLSEIANYKQEKDHLVTLARELNRTIGVYYQSLDVIIDDYIIGWISRGYDDETLLAIAKYCFKSGIRTFPGFASIIDKLYKNGVTTLTALDNYLSEIAHQDEKIKQVLEKAGIERNVTNNDRTLFRTWTEKWNMPYELVCFVAEKSIGANSPIAYINKVLADYKQRSIYSVTQAQKEMQSTATAAPAAKKAVVGEEIQRAKYTDEQISALFTALDDTED